MAQVTYTREAIEDIARAFELLAERDLSAASAAVEAIRSGLSMLAGHPMIGRPRDRVLRELIISYGNSGYVALYRFRPERGEVRVLAIRHQRELDYPG